MCIRWLYGAQVILNISSICLYIIIAELIGNQPICIEKQAGGNLFTNIAIIPVLFKNDDMDLLWLNYSTQVQPRILPLYTFY